MFGRSIREGIEHLTDRMDGTSFLTKEFGLGRKLTEFRQGTFLGTLENTPKRSVSRPTFCSPLSSSFSSPLIRYSLHHFSPPAAVQVHLSILMESPHQTRPTTDNALTKGPRRARRTGLSLLCLISYYSFGSSLTIASSLTGSYMHSLKTCLGIWIEPYIFPLNFSSVSERIG